jgi:hypothetical protein
MVHYDYCPHCGEELPEEDGDSSSSNESEAMDVEIDYEYEADMDLEEAIENIIKADQELVDSLEDGPAKAEVLRIRKMAKIKEE